jgi:hypothetical protein
MSTSDKRHSMVRDTWPSIVGLITVGYTACFLFGFLLEHGLLHILIAWLMMLMGMIAAMFQHWKHHKLKQLKSFEARKEGKPCESHL